MARVRGALVAAAPGAGARSGQEGGEGEEPRAAALAARDGAAGIEAELVARVLRPRADAATQTGADLEAGGGGAA